MNLAPICKNNFFSGSLNKIGFLNFFKRYVSARNGLHISSHLMSNGRSLLHQRFFVTS